MGGSVNLQGGGQYQMPGAGYAGMQGSVNAPQTADQYAAAQAARQQQQPTYPQGPFAFDINNPDSWNPGNWGNTGADTSNPWTGTAAPVQNPYYAYGNQTAPMMTASEATGYAPMNIPGMQLARPSFYYPSISNQMAFMGGMGGMYGGGLGGMGYGGYMGMPGYFSGLGAMGSYMPMMQRSYPTYSNPYPALGGFAQYQPRDPGRAYASGTSTGGKGMRTTQQQPSTPATPTYNPSLQPVAPPSPLTLSPVAPPVSPSLQYNPSPDRSDARPSWADPLLPVNRTGPANAQITGTATATPSVTPAEPELTQPLIPGEPQYPDILQPSPYKPPIETDTSGGFAGVQPGFDPLAGGGLLGGYTMPDMTLPGGGVNPDLFVPGSTIPTAAPRTASEDLEGQGAVARGFDTSTANVMEP